MAALKLDLRLCWGDEIAFGPGKAALLDAIAQTGSISAAAKSMQMSYRRAWLLVDTMNRAFHQPLVIAGAGGKRGGGATLSTQGQWVLAEYQALCAHANLDLAPRAAALLAQLNVAPPSDATPT